MIDVRVLDIQPHPDQATNNPGCWAVRLKISRDGTARTFWRWYTMRELKNGHKDGVGVYTPSNKKPEPTEILARFWDDTFAELHGFSFDKDNP